VTRALRALSSAYVQRRHKVASGSTLDSKGKRAAFALFYGPLHFMGAARAVRALGADAPPPKSILDVGCGTGVAGAAWALAAGGTPDVIGIDRHPWAVGEAWRTYADLRVHGQARVGNLARLPMIRHAAVAAFVLNELPDPLRVQVENQLFAAAAQGARILVIEPIARSVVPWWDATARRVISSGGRADEWRFSVDLPPMLRLFDKAAGLNHREVKVRTLFFG